MPWNLLRVHLLMLSVPPGLIWLINLLNCANSVMRVCVCVVLSCFSCVWLFATPWTAVLHASLSMGFSRQDYWSGLPFPFPGDLPDSGIELESLTYPALAGRFFTSSATCRSHQNINYYHFTVEDWGASLCHLILRCFLRCCSNPKHGLTWCSPWNKSNLRR